MNSLVVQLATLGLGVAASPLPVVGVLIILLSKRAFPGSLTLAVSWVLGIVVALAVAMGFSASIRMPRAGTDLQSEGVFALLLGVGLMITGAITKRSRSRSPQSQEPPLWVSSVDGLSPVAAGLLAFSNATTSPKNLALAITAGRRVVESSVSYYGAASAIAAYVLIASSSVMIPVIIYIFGGRRSAAILQGWRQRITQHATVIMEIMLFVLGVAMSAKGLYNLFG